jgi:hypothetical protein
MASGEVMVMDVDVVGEQIVDVVVTGQVSMCPLFDHTEPECTFGCSFQ